jgi:hypothetical protein
MTPKARILAAAADDIRAFCMSNADAAQASRYARFFTEGYDPYGIPKETWEANRLRFYDQYRDRRLLRSPTCCRCETNSTGRHFSASVPGSSAGCGTGHTQMSSAASFWAPV